MKKIRSSDNLQDRHLTYKVRKRTKLPVPPSDNKIKMRILQKFGG